MRIFLLSFFAVGLWGCTLAATSKVISLNNLDDTDAARAVGRFQRDGQFQCTAFHVGHGVVLTAGHCLPFECHLDGATSTNELTISWAVGEGEAPKVSKVESIHSCAKTASLDFAVLRVVDPPSIAFKLATNAADPSPAKVPLRVLTFAGPDHLVLVDGCTSWKLTGADAQKEYNFSHTCTVSKGSSGSPILLDATGEVVGIHIGGIGIELGTRPRESAFRGLPNPP
jgi:hypothetical protein